MFSVFHGIIGVDEDIVKVDDNGDFKHIGKDVMDKVLESHGSVGKSKWHNMPFKGTVAGVECSLPFISFSNTD